MIREREIKQAANGSLYANFTLQKQLKQMPARLWDITEEQQETLVKKAMVKVEAIPRTYRQKQELTIQRIRLATEEDGISRTELISKKGLSREDLWHELRMLMDEIHSNPLQTVIRHLYSERLNRERLTTYPAAKSLHHSYYAGLLEQMVELALSSWHLLPMYPDVDKDKVLAACLLGDIGKIKALTEAIAPEYTDAGELIGQLVLSVEMINDAAMQTGISMDHPELVTIKHIILSQYGEEGNGIRSTVQAKSAEALFYYHMKRMNTDLRAFQMAREQGSGGWAYVDLFKRRMNIRGTTNWEEGKRDE
ncbi:hypothetical protein [Shouchella shacheensis]|uniref:hypothetical protein n=1 Tax=Shouchella shacheensis TaxID=1649580 RepID=UPI0007403628|nr:hypothetical protein [Shouchella shacheensis]